MPSHRRTRQYPVQVETSQEDISSPEHRSVERSKDEGQNTATNDDNSDKPEEPGKPLKSKRSNPECKKIDCKWEKKKVGSCHRTAEECFFNHNIASINDRKETQFTGIKESLKAKSEKKRKDGASGETQNKTQNKIQNKICVYEFGKTGSCPRRNCTYLHNFTKEQTQDEQTVKNIKIVQQKLLSQMIKHGKSTTDPFLRLVKIMIQDQM